MAINTIFRLRLCFIVAAVLLLVETGFAYGSNVVYVAAHPSQSYSRQQLEAAAEVYGLDVNIIGLGSASDSARAIAAIRNRQSIAIVLDVSALETPYGDQLFAAADAERKKPLMIVGITSQTDAAALRKWSGGAIVGTQRWASDEKTTYEVASDDPITHQLSGSRLPLAQPGVQYFTVNQQTGTEWLISATNGSKPHPVFVVASVGGRQIFFGTIPGSPDAVIPGDLLRGPFVFSVLAPDLMFLRSAAGERAWHAPGHYANLTIDDIWLREPYGYVDYYSLLREMQQHNFHTTIAFIPWNYDRSQPALVTLFREHPDRYSICIHGDNHDHQEFGPFSSKPIAGQIVDMKQGLARMAAFHRLTDLPYDPVMVFPHKMSPEGTLAYLKRYNYWATVNAENVPSDATAPADAEFALRPATLAFADFPSIRRYSAELPIPDWLLAMDAFLGNPVFFYCHEAHFADGIGAFDGLADKVNRLQPDTQWKSLGYITKHLYLEKLRDDGNYDVKLFSSVVSLTNDHGHNTTLFVEKQEDGAVPFTVTLDGQPEKYEFDHGWLRLQVPVAAGATRAVAITYQNDFVLSKTDIAKSSLRVAVLRHLSDFRDDVVSRSAFGRWFIRSYVAYRSDWNHGAEGVAGLTVLFLFLWWRSGKKKSVERSTVA
jgi:hypothetical protein